MNKALHYKTNVGLSNQILIGSELEQYMRTLSLGMIRNCYAKAAVLPEEIF